MVNYQGVNQTQVKSYSRTQTSILTKALAIAGIGFLIICAIGWGFAELFGAQIRKWASGDMITYFFGSIVLMFIGMILSMFWMIRIEKASIGLSIAVYITYVLSKAFAFGMLFLLLEMSQLMMIFGVTGGLFLLMGLVSKLLTTKAAFTLGKFLMVGGFIVLLMSLVFAMLWIFNVGGWLWFYWLILIVTGVLMLWYIAWDFWMIGKMDQFTLFSDDKQAKIAQRNIVLFFGYKLLVDFVGLFWVVASFFIRWFSR